MRILAATFALTASLLCALLAGGYLLSSLYTVSSAGIRLRTRTDQLRVASEKLLDPDALAAHRAAALEVRRAKAEALAKAKGKTLVGDGAAMASRHRTLGIALLAGAALGLVAVFLLFFNRARKTAMLGVTVGSAAGVLGLVLEGFVVLFAVIVGLQLVALALGWRAKRRAPRAPKRSLQVEGPEEAAVEAESTEVTP